MQQLSAKVFKLSFEYLHIYSPKVAIFTEKNSKIASLTSCQRSDLRKTLKYRESWTPCLIFEYPTLKVRRRPWPSAWYDGSAGSWTTVCSRTCWHNGLRQSVPMSHCPNAVGLSQFVCSFQWTISRLLVSGYLHRRHAKVWRTGWGRLMPPALPRGHSGSCTWRPTSVLPFLK